MILLHNRVYLDFPDVKESKIELSPEDKKAYEAEQVAKMDRLKVFAIGEDLDKSSPLKVGDEVYIDPSYFGTRRAFFVVIDEKKKLVVPYSEILHIW